MNIPDLYARVVAKRPELGFVYLRHDGACWTTGKTIYCDSTAAALILALWVEALPGAAWLGRTTTPVHGWRVCYRNDRSETTSYDLVRFSPIEALAAFYLGETT